MTIEKQGVTQLPFVGETFVDVVRLGDHELQFQREDETYVRIFHDRDCCETVEIESVNGDLADLRGSPLLMAEVVSQRSQEHEHGTWTFYKFATVKGYVTVRWLGVSNGSYSEGVDMQDSRDGQTIRSSEMTWT